MGCLKQDLEHAYTGLKVVYSAASKSGRELIKDEVETGYYYFGEQGNKSQVNLAFGRRETELSQSPVFDKVESQHFGVSTKCLCGKKYYDPRTSQWLSVDPLASKYPNMSPYNYCAENPVKYGDLDGRDFVLLIAKNGAAGKGHMGAVIQDKNGAYYYVTMGAAENAGLLKMASSGVQGGMNIQPLKDAKSMNDAINIAKQDKNNSPYTDQVLFKTDSQTDQKIFENVYQQAEKINSGEIQYNVCTMNCTDAVERPIEKAIGVKLPENMVPNNNFENLKKNQGVIQDFINLKSGSFEIDYIPSGLDNYPASGRPIIVPNKLDE